MDNGALVSGKQSQDKALGLVTTETVSVKQNVTSEPRLCFSSRPVKGDSPATTPS